MAQHKGVKDSGEFFVINPTSRKVTVPHAHKAIGAVGDHNSEQITFECPQMVDGHDVSQCARRYVTWVNVNGVIGHDALELTQVEKGTDGMIYLSWTVRGVLTEAKGIVQFSIHFEDVDENKQPIYSWGTTTCKDCEILDCINGLIATYEAVYVAGDALVFADYIPVTDGTAEINTTMIPEGQINITRNGKYDVGQFASAQVSVNAEEPEIYMNTSGEICASANGIVSTTLAHTLDSDLKSSNIRSGVEVFGIQGAYKTIDPANGTYEIFGGGMCYLQSQFIRDANDGGLQIRDYGEIISPADGTRGGANLECAVGGLVIVSGADKQDYFKVDLELSSGVEVVFKPKFQNDTAGEEWVTQKGSVIVRITEDNFKLVINCWRP